MPDPKAVRRVNSKADSHTLGEALFGLHHEELYWVAKALMERGTDRLEEGSFLVKDLFGVSGKGTILISSPAMLRAVVRHPRNEEMRGQQTAILKESLLDRKTDLSCLMRIAPDGTLTILSIQGVMNDGFSIRAIWTAGLDLHSVLEAQRDFGPVEPVAKALFRDGYHGHVCLDSMILRDGWHLRIVEINARKPMGLVNHHIDRFLSKFGVTGRLVQFSMQVQSSLTFAALLDRLDREALFFRADRPWGLLPLSARILVVTRRTGLGGEIRECSHPGRLYTSVISGVRRRTRSSSGRRCRTSLPSHRKLRQPSGPDR